MMNLADPELELIDPTPNVHAMFLHFDNTFFWASLSKRCVVRWSKRMYSCAGICSYEGRGGLCDIALSEPLLKLRPRKDLVETLLHEMIHAYLFVTRQDQNRDGHGPKFQEHMHRINRAAGLNISIYHDFHDEVKLYQTHWWRCNGLCQLHKPYFGIVRRPNNRAPGPSDHWWNSHQKYCGGTFIKIKEPDKPEKKGKNTNVTKPNADITKYINTNNNNKVASNKNIIQNDKSMKPVLKDTSNVFVNPKLGIKSNNSSTVVVTKKNDIFSPQVPKSKPVVSNVKRVTTGTEQPNNGERKRSSSTDVLETVRNVWANKEIGSNSMKQISKVNNSKITPNLNKHKPNNETESPPAKVKKIDDYFKTTATSILKGLYGQNFNITESNADQKLKAIPKEKNFVDCPVCNIKIDSSEINRHLDECLNNDIIQKLSKEIDKYNNIPVINNESYATIKCVNNFEGAAATQSEFKKHLIDKKSDNGPSSDVRKQEINNDIIDLPNIKLITDVNRKRSRTSFDQSDFRSSEQIDEINHRNSKLRKSDTFTRFDVSNINIQTSPVIINPTIKVEPGCSKSDAALHIKIESNSSNPHITPEIKIEAGCSKSDTTSETACPCCGDKLNTSVDEHLDECLSFFEADTTIPVEGASTSYVTIVIDDDDDKFDDSQTFNATGTKLPCPCCLRMIEEIDMNNHLDKCLS